MFLVHCPRTAIRLFAAVQCTEHGLNTHEVDRRLDEYGPNRLPETKRNPWLVFLGGRG